jgi:excisionase family DNA binding protein
MTEPSSILDVLAEALAPRIAEFLFPEGQRTPIEKPLSLDGLAELTGISRSTLAELAKQRRIPHYRAGRRLFFTASEVLASLKVPATTEGGDR